MLDILNENLINEGKDPIAFDHDCREGICGMCSLYINGRAHGPDTVSCSNKKTVIISGKINGGSPQERIEIVEMSGVATLPIANFGVDAQGNFSDTIQIPKNGVYTLSYGGNYEQSILKGEENLRLSDNLIFLKSKPGYINQDEQIFNTVKKFRSDLNKEMDNLAKSTGADGDLVTWKKEELDVNFIMIFGAV
ncbi:hypothetical protein FQR65_LT19589 [Abscondita terminalis]|nr:hypothetical protein FQR65_LT19589 [Abscondita terminalis]